MLALVILAPLLFNLTGIIDTYLTKLLGNRQKAGTLESSTGTLMITGGIIALLVSVVIFCIVGTQVFTIGTSAIVSIFIAGIFYGLAAFPYFEALKGEKIENIIPILQTIPVFTWIIAHFVLGETLSLLSIFLMIAIVIVTIVFNWNFQTKTFNYQGMILVLTSSLLYALNFISFKFGGESVENVWISFFWEHIGVAMISLVFLFGNKTRTSTLHYFKQKGIGFSLLNAGNEISYIIGILIINYLILYYNVAFIETLSQGLQPLLGFLMVFLAYKLFPHIYIRDYKQKELVWKLSLCGIIFLLLFLFYRST